MNSSFGWADEISRLFFVWAIFLGIPIGIRARAHIGITMLTSRLPQRQQERLQTGTSAIGACLMALVTWEAVVISVQQWDELMISVDISNAWFTLALAVGCLHACLHLTRITLFGQYAA